MIVSRLSSSLTPAVIAMPEYCHGPRWSRTPCPAAADRDDPDPPCGSATGCSSSSAPTSAQASRERRRRAHGRDRPGPCRSAPPGRRAASTCRWPCGLNPAVSPGWATRFSSSTLRARASTNADRIPGTSRLASTEVYQEPGPMISASAALSRRPPRGRPAGPRARGAMRLHRPGGDRHLAPGRGRSTARQDARARPSTSATMCRPCVLAGSTRPCAPSSAPTQSRPVTRSPVCSHRAVMSRLPRAWPPSSPRGEPVLDHRTPGAAPGVVAAQRGQRHPQVPGRRHAQVPAQPSRRPAVVGHPHDRGEPVGDRPQGAQGHRQAVAPADRDDQRSRADGRPDPGRHRHSLPRSRWTTETARPARASRAASCSTMATDRCLPPVQPTAIIANRLPSAR